MIDSLLALAAELSVKVNANEADLRRATSTAYYAAFHALCEMLADQMIPLKKSPLDVRLSRLYVRVYRSVKHEHIWKRDLFQNSDATKTVQTSLDNLRQKRIEADYIPLTFHYLSTEVNDFISEARETVANIRALNEADRLSLTVNMLVGPEKPETGQKKNTK